MLRLGLISDTHGLLRPEAAAALRGCDHILHAGDIGDPAILEALASIAPVTAVRGNNDRAPWADPLREVERLELGGVALGMIHDLAELDRHAVLADVRVVVCGHSHRPRVHEHAGTLFVNPGSAGPRRFSLPVAVAHLSIAAGAVQARIVELAIDP
ncbi:MAG TPA: metallophosphoesterase family protein [Burkholderiaceae bacterium]|jgi:putative phosphoesterase